MEWCWPFKVYRSCELSKLQNLVGYGGSAKKDKREWNLKIFSMCQWGLGTTVFFITKRSFSLIKYYTWVSGFGSTNSKGNIFLFQTKQNKNPQKNFCLSSRTYTYNLTIAWGVSTVGSLIFNSLLWDQKCFSPGDECKMIYSTVTNEIITLYDKDYQ